MNPIRVLVVFGVIITTAGCSISTIGKAMGKYGYIELQPPVEFEEKGT